MVSNCLKISKIAPNLVFFFCHFKQHFGHGKAYLFLDFDCFLFIPSPRGANPARIFALALTDTKINYFTCDFRLGGERTLGAQSG